jgi:regulator of cell morphogenesis and NO signaling
MKTQNTSLPDNEETQQLLQRYNMEHAHNLVYSFDGLTALGIDAAFILALLQVQEDKGAFKQEDFGHFRFTTIVEYIRKTHQYYLNKKMPEIEQNIHLLLKNYPDAHPLLVILSEFYKDYREDLRKHILFEERELLPYILHLEKVVAGEAKLEDYRSNFTLNQFLEQHHDAEEDLQKVCATILDYSPPEGNQTLYRILVSQLQVFEKDLAVHALIEDEVLLPRAMELEKRLSQPR